MPAVSDKQRRWSYTEAGKKALGESAKHFQDTPGKLPETAMKKPEKETKAEDKAEGGKEEPGDKKKKPSVSERMNAHMRARAGIKAY